MKQVGVVSEIIEENAKVQFKRASACGENCAMCGGCEKLNSFVIAKNVIKADVGDTVILETDTKRVLLAAFLVYILPVILGIFSYVFLGALVGIVMFFVPFVVLFLINKKLEGKYMPEIVRKI
ncbi:MAG: SoxR reducing system RseC family protein [Clostridia bacterium]|nr:SoxR reducing system RseC family protein [Clostridia bacterium]